MFVGVSATQAGCCCPGLDYPEATVDIPEPSPEIAALIDRCNADADDCTALCEAALAMHVGTEVAIVECDVGPLASATGTGVRVRIAYDPQIACGRIPHGLVAAHVGARDPVTAWLVRAAHLEAASVAAFVHLAADLVRLGAPRALVARALTAANDEARHAALVRSLLTVDVPPARVAPYRPSTLRALALHNAVEGCARETVGAAINLHQARFAADARIRAIYAQIADDEVSHAELAWAIHAWATTQLSASDVAAVIAAQRAVLAAIQPMPRHDALGLPDEGTHRAMVAAVLQLTRVDGSPSVAHL